MKKFLFLLFFILLIDFAFKQYILHSIPLMHDASPVYPYDGIAVFKGWLGGIDFSINHVTNRGGAWGIFSTHSSLLLIFRILVILFLGIHIFFFNKQKQRRLPYILILAGAWGNVIDCLIYGHVIDMFLFNLWGYFFPLFNIADTVIFFGVALLCIQTLVKKSHDRIAHKPSL